MWDIVVVTAVSMAPVYPLALAGWVHRSAVRLDPARWFLQVASLAVPAAFAFLSVHYSCAITEGSQPRCPEALGWAPTWVWSLYALQVCIGILLAWASPRRSLWIPLQALFLVHGLFIAFGAILAMTGQWL